MALGTVSIVIIVILALIIIYLVYAYNRFVVLRNRIENAWSQIDVQLKRRFDLIPNLVKTVKGYAKHEKDTLKEITEARNLMKDAKSPHEKAKANNMLSGALKSLFAVAESYPDLKASKNFMQLQEELSGTESKIAYARQFYNDSVLEYENKRERFPTNLIANMFNFKEKDFFKSSGKERENVNVEF